MWCLFEGGAYSGAAIIQVNTVPCNSKQRPPEAFFVVFITVIVETHLPADVVVLVVLCFCNLSFYFVM